MTMYKWCFLAFVILLALCVSGCFGKKYTYSDITEGRNEKVAGVSCLSYEDSENDCDRMQRWLLEGEYRTFKGSLGSTSQRTFSFQDIEGNTLYTVIDVGNQNVIQVEIEGRLRTYQRRDRTDDE